MCTEPDEEKDWNIIDTDEDDDIVLMTSEEYSEWLDEQNFEQPEQNAEDDDDE